jgi:hypothetical protein
LVFHGSIAGVFPTNPMSFSSYSLFLRKQSPLINGNAQCYCQLPLGIPIGTGCGGIELQKFRYILDSLK